MKAAWHIATKDLQLLFRDRMALFWVLGFPLLFAVFLGTVLEAALSGSGALLPVRVITTAEPQLGAMIFAGLERTENVQPIRSNEEDALEAVRRGEAIAAVYAPAPVANDAREPSTPMPRVAMVIDPAREMEATMVQAELLRILAERNAAPHSAPSNLLSVTHLPLPSPRRASDYVFAPAVLWGLIGCAACFAISLVSERTRGTLKRLLTAPLRRSTILLGKALACWMACTSVGLLSVLIAWLGFEVRFEHPVKLMLALLSSGVCFAGITMLLSVLGRTEQSVAGAGWACLIVLAMFGGGMVPLSFLPTWVADVGHVSPVRWGIVALEGALWRGFSYRELWHACSVLLFTGVVTFGLGSVLFSRSLE